MDDERRLFTKFTEFGGEEINKDVEFKDKERNDGL